jgi:membrane protease YdiL (CAAX protease family)
MSTRNKGILSYLALAFGMAWGLWEIPIRCGLSPRHPLFQLALLPGAFAPAIAAIIVRRWVTGEGFTDAGLRLNLRKWPYYLVAWLLPIPVTMAIVMLASIMRLTEPDFSLQRFMTWFLQGANPPTLPFYFWFIVPLQFLITALIATFLLWGEEFGWRGYLQLRLFGGRPLLAAVTTGLIWGVWHYPINLRGYNYPDNLCLGLIIFPVGTVLLSIIFGWLRLRTGSIWPASLAHSATNAIGGSLMMMLFMGGPNWIFVSYLGILAWVPLGALCAWIVLTGQLKSEPLSDKGGQSDQVRPTTA